MPPLSIAGAAGAQKKSPEAEPLAGSSKDNVMPSPELTGKDKVQEAIARSMAIPSKENQGAQELLRGGLTAVFGGLLSLGKAGPSVGGR